MKENEISRILTKQERLLMLNELIVPEVLQEGKMFLDEDLILVNQLIEKAEMAVISMIDPEVERFFKWIIEQFDGQVTKNTGGKVFSVTIFIWYDQADEHVKVHCIPKCEEKILFVVDKKGYGEGIAVINKTLEKIDILKNFDLTSTGQEGDYKGWPYMIRNIIMRLDLL